MINNFFILLRQELLISALIFILLFIKLGKDRSNESILHIINLLLCLNFVAGFVPMLEGALFGYFDYFYAIICMVEVTSTCH
jgi:NADH-quinone oxidoreductase subunit N